MLSIVSILSVLNITGVADKDNGNEDELWVWSPRDRLQCVYSTFFGLIIFLSDLKTEWANKFYNMQSILFYHFYFLATQMGRAFFYFYVGSITLLMLPGSTFWNFTYFFFGTVLCLLGIAMIVLHVCFNSPPSVGTEQQVSEQVTR